MPANPVSAVTVSDDPRVYEDKHVHAVYNEIAPHFSSTRYKVCTDAEAFLKVNDLHNLLALAHHRTISELPANRLGRPRLWHR